MDIFHTDVLPLIISLHFYKSCLVISSNSNFLFLDFSEVEAIYLITDSSFKIQTVMFNKTLRNSHLGPLALAALPVSLPLCYLSLKCRYRRLCCRCVPCGWALMATCSQFWISIIICCKRSFFAEG